MIARDRPAAIADAGQGWQLVLESIPASAIADDQRPELARRDATMNVVSAADRRLESIWSGRQAPTLERARRLYLDDDPRFPTYFLPPRRR